MLTDIEATTITQQHSSATLEFIESKQFVKPGSVLNFPYPEEVFDRFMDVVGGFDPIIHTELSHKEVNRNQDGSDNISYARGILEARLPNLQRNGRTPMVHLVFNYNNQVPQQLICFGDRQVVCDNLFVWNAEQVARYVLTDSTEGMWAQLEKWVEDAEEAFDRNLRKAQQFDDLIIGEQRLYESIGRAIHLSMGNKYRVGTSDINGAIDLMLNQRSSRYGLTSPIETTASNFLNALTDVISQEDKYLDAKAPKALSAVNLFEEIFLN